MDEALLVEQTEAAIRKLVDAAPPLTAETRARLAVLLLAPAGTPDTGEAA